jgi:hypothetical protein
LTARARLRASQSRPTRWLSYVATWSLVNNKQIEQERLLAGNRIGSCQANFVGDTSIQPNNDILDYRYLLGSTTNAATKPFGLHSRSD